MDNELDRALALTRDRLVVALSAAVPLHIMELRALSPDERVALGRRCVDDVAAHGDTLMFGGKRGEAARTFNSLARGLAVLAYAPGGVEFLGQRWSA